MTWLLLLSTETCSQSTAYDSGHLPNMLSGVRCIAAGREEIAMTEMILLGAGASADAGIPTSTAMTQKIREHFERDKERADEFNVVAFVIGGLQFQQAINASRGAQNVDVEDLFNAVHMLALRRNIEAAPFVERWHPRVAELDRWVAPHIKVNDYIHQSYAAFAEPIRAALEVGINRALIGRERESPTRDDGSAIPMNDTITGVDVETIIGDYLANLFHNWEAAFAHSTPGRKVNLAKAFRDAVNASLPQDGGGSIFAETADLMTQALIGETWIRSASKVRYLQPILNLYQNQGRLVVATLNYDNSLERMAEQNDVICKTGLEEWTKTGAFAPGVTDFYLLKLHGSIDWVLNPDSINNDWDVQVDVYRTANPAERQRLLDRASPKGYRPGIVFGQRNKLTARGPFLDLFHTFKTELNSCSRLTVIGYSFRDEHINTCIAQWMNRDPNNKMRVVKRNFTSDVSNGFWDSLWIARQDDITKVEGTAKKMLPTLFP